MESMPISKRNMLKLAIATTFGMLMPACAINQQKETPGPFMVNTKNIEDLKGLIRAIKEVGGKHLPTSLSVEDIYKSIAQTTVDNARKAADLGMQVPEWILDRLPGKKVAALKSPVQPETIALVLVGMVFLVPWTLFFVVVFASLLTLTRYITEKLNERTV